MSGPAAPSSSIGRRARSPRPRGCKGARRCRAPAPPRRGRQPARHPGAAHPAPSSEIALSRPPATKKHTPPTRNPTPCSPPTPPPPPRLCLVSGLQGRRRGTGLAVLTASWVVAEPVGAGAGGRLIGRFPIRSVILAAAVLPLGSALLAIWVFKGHSARNHHGPWTADDEARSEESRAGGGVLRILAVTASLVLLIQVGAGGELALLPLLVTTHLQLSAAISRTAMLAAAFIGGALFIPPRNASDRSGP